MAELAGPDGRSRLAATGLVSLGLGVVGVASFVYLAVAGRSLGAVGAAPVAVAWNVINSLALGLYAGVEQHVARRTSAAAHGAGPIDVRREVGPYLVGSLAGLALLATVFGGWVADWLFGGSVVIVWLVVGSFASHAYTYLVRGMLAGADRFHRYGAQLAIDGALRIVGALVVAVSPWRSAAAYLVVLVVSPALSTVLSAGRLDLPSVELPELQADVTRSGNVLGVVGLTLVTQVVANLGPLAIAPKALGNPELVSAFTYTTTIARLPVFAFAAVQAVVLPTLVARVARGDRAGYCAALRRASILTAALGVMGFAGVILLGRRIVGLLYGPAFAVDEQVLVLLAASAVPLLGGLLCAQALLALHADRFARLGWFAALIIHGLVLLPTGRADVVVAWSMVLGAGVGVLTLGWMLRRAIRTGFGAARSGSALTSAPREEDPR